MDKRIYLFTSVAFVVGMVELIIGGILDLVALDLGVSVGSAGLLITVFALVFAISGPVLLFWTGRAERKPLMLTALLVFLIGNIIAVFSASYGVLLLARIVTAASGALLTVLSLTLAAQIAGPGYRGRAIGLVVMGISGSIVLGLPIGVSMGHAFGWRSPFLLVIVLTVLLMVGVAALLGQLTTEPPAPLTTQLNALRDKKIVFAHLTTFFFLAGHFTLYGFLTPFVIATMGYTGNLITMVYFLYGAAAVTGGGVAGVLADRFGPRRTLLTATTLLVGCLLIIPLATAVPAAFWLVLIVWGVLSWAITPPIQSHLVELAPETAGIQQSLNNSVVHLGIALGTLTGSMVIDRFSVEQNAIVGAFFVALALAAASVTLKRERKTRRKTAS